MALKTFTPLSNMELSAFCSQMAMILRSGIFAMEGISIMRDDAKDSDEYELLEQIDLGFQESGTLHKALQDTQAFPDYMVQMVRIGEETGRLDDVMGALTVYYDREASIARTIRNALTYPLIMIFMMLLVILVLIIKIMPIFDQIFQQLGGEMTGLSRTLLNIGTVINRYSIVFFLLADAIAILIFYFGRTKRGRKQFVGIAAHLSWTRTLVEQLAACRFASGMSLTLSSGMSPEECLTLARGLIAHEAFGEKIEICARSLSQGHELHKAFLDAGIFTGLYARMAAIGDRTGALDEVMQDIADAYQEEIDQRFTGLIAALEPTLVIILSLIVGMILLSVMLPLMGIMASL